MGTSRQDIQNWLEDGKDQGATHMIVVCDTYDFEDYPVYVMPDEDVKKKAARYNDTEHMKKVMEVYDISKEWDNQLNKQRCFDKGE